jgi:predicted transcriptional regulator
VAEYQTHPTVDFLDIAREITVAWLSNPNVNAAASDVPAFLKAMHATISELSSGPTIEETDVPVEFVPAVAVRSSIKPEYLISLINGKKYKTLKRHLALHGLTPQDYRERYGLKSDYPMVASNYSEHRREVARKLGLGRRSAQPVAQEQSETIAIPAEPERAQPKRSPVKTREDKASASITKAQSEPDVSEKALAVPASLAETIIIAETVSTPVKAKVKRVFARPAAAETVASSEELTAIPPKQKKPRAIAKLKALPQTDDAELVATKPKRGRPKKQVAEV